MCTEYPWRGGYGPGAGPDSGRTEVTGQGRDQGQLNNAQSQAAGGRSRHQVQTAEGSQRTEQVTLTCALESLREGVTSELVLPAEDGPVQLRRGRLSVMKEQGVSS